MYDQHSAANVLRKIGLLALIGFGTIVFSGPVIALLSVALSLGTVLAGFALVGVLIWLPFRLLTGGTQVAMAGVEEMGHDVGRLLGGIVRGSWRLASFPLRLGGAALVGTLVLAGRVLHLTGTTIAILSGIALAAGTGAVAGAFVGFATSGSSGEMETTIPLNALAGGLLGATTGIVMTIRERRRVARPAIG